MERGNLVNALVAYLASAFILRCESIGGTAIGAFIVDTVVRGLMLTCNLVCNLFGPGFSK